MERRVKERMIGAAVLMAAAIILIPEMLSGPRHAEGETPRAATGETPLKTYTIDLSKAPGAQPAVPTTGDRAPPPERVVPLPDQPAATEHVAQEPIATVDKPTQQSTPAQTESRPAERRPSESRLPEMTASRPTPDIVAPPPPPETAAPATSTVASASSPTPAATPASPPSRPAAVAAAPPTSTSGAWAVQVGSFSKEETATKISQELRAQGNPAFVMPVKSGSTTLYRVRIGPMRDRGAAEDLMRRLQSTNPAAAVVTHP